MRVATLTLLVFALGAATASAAPFGELPFAAVASTATCLRATGAPGELVRSSGRGARFLTVGPGGIAESGSVTTGVAQGDCPQVAARPNGAGVIAQAGSGLWVATREPGGDWTKPVKLALEASRAAVAVADSGAAVVAWVEPGTSVSVKASRRPAGGTFGPAVTLATVKSADEFSAAPAIRTAIAADGEQLVLWTQPPADPATGRMPVHVAIAPAGGTFGAAQRVGETRVRSVPALAAAPDGRALAVFWNGKEVQAAERAPGGAFAPAAKLASATDPFVVMPTVAIGSGGAAVAGWYGLFSQGVSAVARAGAGAFGAPVQIAASGGIPGLDDRIAALLSVFGSAPEGVSALGPDGDGGNLRAALTPDGRALLTWNDAPANPRVAAFPLGGGHLDRFPVGARVRQAGSVTPLITSAGTPAVAWADNDGVTGGRVHAAVEGFTAAPDPPAPRAELGRPRDAVLAGDEPLRVPISCSAACEVRVDLPEHFSETVSFALSRAGKELVAIDALLSPIAPVRRGPVRVRLRVSAPGARSATERIESVTLVRKRGSGPPQVRGLEAVRHGSRVDVSWRSVGEAEPDSFLVLGTPSRVIDVAGLTSADAKPAGKGRYTARLSRAGDVRYVFVFAGGENGSLGGPYVTRVR